MSEQTKLPKNWHRLPRNRRLQILAKTVPSNFDELPEHEQQDIEIMLAIRAGMEIDPLETVRTMRRALNAV